MKKYVFLMLGCVCVLLIAGGIKRVREKNPFAWVEKNQPVISHACGGLWETNEEGEEILVTYSNSAEALAQSLENGFRLIEVDFMMTTDGVLACTHDWPQDEQQAAQSQEDETQGEQEQEGQPISSEEWKAYKVNGKYTSQTLEDILQAMLEYPDMYLITDIKSEHSVEETREEFTLLYEQAKARGGKKLLSRIIPQIYNAKMYDVIKEIYDWKSVIFTLYELDEVPDEEILAFIREKENIPVVTVPKRRMSESFSEKIHAEEKLVFTHTIDTVEQAQEYIKMGADGVYTNAILPAQAAELW